MVVSKTDYLCQYPPAIPDVYAAKLSEAHYRAGRFNRRAGDLHHEALTVQKLYAIESRVIFLKVHQRIVYASTGHRLFNLRKCFLDSCEMFLNK